MSSLRDEVEWDAGEAPFDFLLKSLAVERKPDFAFVGEAGPVTSISVMTSAMASAGVSRTSSARVGGYASTLSLNGVV